MKEKVNTREKILSETAIRVKRWFECFCEGKIFLCFFLTMNNYCYSGEHMSSEDDQSIQELMKKKTSSPFS